jgi:hypothetical protein
LMSNNSRILFRRKGLTSKSWVKGNSSVTGWYLTLFYPLSLRGYGEG